MMVGVVVGPTFLFGFGYRAELDLAALGFGMEMLSDVRSRP